MTAPITTISPGLDAKDGSPFLDTKHGPAPDNKPLSQQGKFWETTVGWFPELGSLVVGLAIFGAMAIILAVYDGREQPTLPLGLTINSALQYLTTLAKLAFVVPIIDGLGQLKWLWFASRPRPLLDFQLYDEASRGGFMAVLKLLLRLRDVFRWPLPWLASALLFSAIFTPAVTQQVVTFETKLVETDERVAEAPRVSLFSRWDGSKFQLERGDQLDMEHAIISAAYLEPSKSIAPLDPHCPTANCNFPPYGTVGMCAEVLNVTDLANGQLKSLYFTLANTSITTLTNNLLSNGLAAPYPLSYNIGALLMNEPSYVFGMERTAAALSNTLLLYTTGAVNITNLRPETLHYAEIIVYACTKALKSTVQDGIKTTVETSSAARVVSGGAASLNARWNLDKTDFQPQFSCKPGVAGETITLAVPEGLPTQTKLGMELCTALTSSTVINAYMQGFIALRGSDKVVLSNVGQLGTALSTALFGGFMGRMPSREEQETSLQGMVRNIGDGLTNMLRANGASYRGSSGVVIGTTLDARTIVRVRWAWFVLLAAQLVLTAGLVGAIIVTTWRSGLQNVKGSSMATLCVLDTNVRRDLGLVGDVRSQERMAADLTMKLRLGDSLMLVRGDEEKG
ncbi:hypothetical protein QBC34DRAFT_431891 [Podospora aff. communis PSN243]|uniref:Uncharacterized protein n=1 Tax=Podospora aff. communis PSN243 TaxID=3040156 RepID=A0AAV9FYL8_9PEZI|nr:hypothetical protein QBC34DRAFT_431891 [Podospora aff. communis PSN243]